MTADPEPWLDTSGLHPQRYAENRMPTHPTKWAPRTDEELVDDSHDDADRLWEAREWSHLR